MPSPISTFNVSSHVADADDFQLSEDEKKWLMNLDETSKEPSDDMSNQILDRDRSKEIFNGKSEEAVAQLREKCSGEFAISPRSASQSSEDGEPVGQSDRTFSNSEEVVNRGLGTLSPILLLFPLVATLLVVPLVTLAFKTTDQSRPLQTNGMTSNERSQTTRLQSNDDKGKSSRDLVETSIRGAKKSPATAVASLPATKDVGEAADSADVVEANPAKNVRQRHRPSRVAIYHRNQRAWQVPKRNLRFNAIY